MLENALNAKHKIHLREEVKTFAVRIQLADNEQYPALHKRMAEHGFVKEIETLDRESRQLPDAEYFLLDQPLHTQAKQVFEQVARIIKEHKRTHDLTSLKAQYQVVEVADLWVDLDAL